MELTHFNLDACNALLRLRRERKISWRAFALGTVIASFASKDTGEAWPSRAMLSAITGIDKSDISNTARELQDAGFLTIKERVGQTTVYRLTRRRIATGGDLPPVGVSPPITMKEQSKNNEYAQNDEKPLSSSAPATPSEEPNHQSEKTPIPSPQGNQTTPQPPRHRRATTVKSRPRRK